VEKIEAAGGTVTWLRGDPGLRAEARRPKRHRKPALSETEEPESNEAQENEEPESDT
jgi:hypothetical protein